MANRYIHTMNDRLAYFDGEHIYYARHGIPLKELIVPSLYKIRRQQKKAIEYRLKNGLHIHHVYDYFRVAE